MKSRDPELNSNWGTNCTLVPMVGADGKNRKGMTADMKGMFRIIQSIPLNMCSIVSFGLGDNESIGSKI